MPFKMTLRGAEKPDEKLQALVEKKCQKLKKHFTKVDSIHIVFSGEGSRLRADLAVQSGHFHGNASCEDTDFGRAFDRALKTVEKQISRRKEKIQTRKLAVGSAIKADRRKAAAKAAP